MYNTLILGKDYPIQASTRDEMLVWISAIEEAKVRVVPIVRAAIPSFPLLWFQCFTSLHGRIKHEGVMLYHMNNVD